MRRSKFLMLGAAPLLLRALPVRAQSDADPAMSSARQSLRVLLGPGTAQAAGAGTFDFNGRSYRGQFMQLDDGQIVNVVDLEEYLYGVLPAEMSPRWPPEALAAQAICARTFVLERSDPRRSYDLVPSELDQVYRGVEAEMPGTTGAVNGTAGRVLRFGSAFAQVAYSSCCGGHTESSADAWGSAPLPYLQGVVCTQCADSPNFRWSGWFDMDAIASPFAATLAPFGMLQDLRITARDGSGRARAFQLVADRGSFIVQGSAFRRSIGARQLRSLLIISLARQRQGDTSGVAIVGGGLGHGVGLCQWGARGMAQSGARAADILAHYFPGTVVANLT